MPYPTPSTNESFEHYIALGNSPRYLPISQLADGYIYLIHARNSYLGIWDGAAKVFVILREKCGNVFLFVENHWDTGELHGTAKPFVKLTGPVAGEDRRKALDEAHARVSYDQFRELTHAFFE